MSSSTIDDQVEDNGLAGGNAQAEDSNLEYPEGLKFLILDPRHYGNCFPFFFYNGEPLVVFGPNWIQSVLLLVIVFAFFVVFDYRFFGSKSYPLLTYWVYVLGKSLYIGVVVSLVLKNPGIQSRERSYNPQNKDKQE